MRNYERDTFVRNENIITNENEIIFLADYEKDLFIQESSIWKLDYKQEKVYKLKTGLKKMLHVTNKEHDNLIIAVIKEQSSNDIVTAFNYNGEIMWEFPVQELVVWLIAENEGFKVIEIRDARRLKTSPQQQKQVGKLLEGVIVLEK